MVKSVVEDVAAEIAHLRAEAASCRACDLWKNATRLCLARDRPAPTSSSSASNPATRRPRGTPVVGPAGLVFDRALEEAGVDRNRAYVTNAVKHFKFEPRGS